MQTVKDRTRHVWLERPDKGDWKCVICGAVTTKPYNDEDIDFQADRYERLTSRERNLAPFIPGILSP